MKRIFLLACASMMCGVGMFPADFYVSTTGNDSANGSANAPFATLERARAAVQDLKGRKPGRTNPIVVMHHGVRARDEARSFVSKIPASC